MMAANSRRFVWCAVVVSAMMFSFVAAGLKETTGTTNSLVSGLQKNGESKNAVSLGASKVCKETSLNDSDNSTKHEQFKDKEEEISSQKPFTMKPDSTILDYLNPDLLKDPELLDAIGHKLRDGVLVVIEDAFVPEFAEAVHEDLLKVTTWKLYEEYNDDGFTFHHHNIYDESEDFTELLNATTDMMNHPVTREFIEELSGRDCSDIGGWGASYYKPGDYSLPHSDWFAQRSVALVWHLTKDWKPEWGGALYWEAEPGNTAYNHASFNTLSLFSVTSNSSHFVTHVSPHANGKRLAFNGWTQSAWLPDKDDRLEEMFGNQQQRLGLTEDQAFEILEMDLEDFDSNRREGIKMLQAQILAELRPEEVTVMKV